MKKIYCLRKYTIGQTPKSMQLIEIYKDMAQTEQASDNYKEACEYYEKYTTLDKE